MKKPSVAFANSAEQNDLVALKILFAQWIQSVDSFVREEESSKKDSLDLNPVLWYKKDHSDSYELELSSITLNPLL